MDVYGVQDTTNETSIINTYDTHIGTDKCQQNMLDKKQEMASEAHESPAKRVSKIINTASVCSLWAAIEPQDDV
jgi:hypothetical protein